MPYNEVGSEHLPTGQPMGSPWLGQPRQALELHKELLDPGRSWEATAPSSSQVKPHWVYCCQTQMSTLKWDSLLSCYCPKQREKGSGTSEDERDRRSPQLRVGERWFHIGALKKWDLGLGYRSADEAFQCLPSMSGALGSIPRTTSTKHTDTGL